MADLVLKINQTFEQDGTDTGVTVTYLVEANQICTGEQLLAEFTPKKGSRYSTASRMIAGQRTARRNPDNPLLWTVTVPYKLYSVSVSINSSKRLISGPDFGTVPYQVAAVNGYFIDASGNEASSRTPIETSAGNPFDTPPMIEVRNITFNFVQLEKSSFDPIKAQAYIGTLNKTAVTVAGVSMSAGEGLLKDMKPTVTPDGDYQTYYEFEYAKMKAFNISLLDQDFKFLRDYSGTKKPDEILLSDINSEITAGSKDDKPVSDPVKLDGSGGILTDGGSPVYRTWRVLPKADWNAGLNLIKRGR